MLVGLALLTATGCVRRRLTVRSNPPGAVVYVDNQRIGTTPCSVDYVYYGTREIRLTMQGYETLTVNQPLPAPWYELPGLDFVSENLVPTTITDARTVSFNLRRELLVPAEQIIARGEQLRRQATPSGLAPFVTPVGGVAPLNNATAPFAPPPSTTPAPTPFSAVSPLPAPNGPQTFEASPPVEIAPASAPPAPGLQDTFRY